MSLDYWRNEAKTLYLSVEDGKYIFQCGEGMYSSYDITPQDLEKLKTSIEFLLRTECRS